MPLVRVCSELPDAVIAVSPLARWWYRDTPAMRRVLYAIEKAPGRAFARYAMGTRISPAEWVDPLPKSPMECIGDVDIPLLVVYGDADRYFPIQHGEELVRASRHAQLWVESGMGHGEKAATPDLLRRLTTWAQRAKSSTAPQHSNDGRTGSSRRSDVGMLPGASWLGEIAL